MPSWVFWRKVLIDMGLFLGMFFLASGIAHAAGTGAEIVEFTGGATKLFESLRAVNFVRGIAIALFALTIVAGIGGYISGGWTSVIASLLLIGGWMGAEPIVDTIFGAGVVI